MGSTKETRPRGHLGRGALLALLLHAQIIVPLVVMVFIYAAREARQREEEVDVAFRDVPAEELPADLPSLEDLSHPAKPEPEPEVRQKPRKEKEKTPPKPPKVAEQKPSPPPKPEAKVVPPEEKPKEEPPPPPPPQPKPEGHEKMVDIDNKDADDKPPPDAKFLAEKNHHTDHETRAKDTNLEKAQKGSEGSPSAPSDRQDQEVGADKRKIAELEDQKSAAGRSAPKVTPHAKPELSQDKPAPDEPKPKSLLALRDAPHREHELTPETADPSLPRAPDGNIALPQDRGVRGPKSDAAALSAGKRMKLRLTSNDYEYMFGADAEAERRLASKERSSKVGRFQKRLDRVKSALENFIPEVQPGNQDALNTRAAPFAAFIARMHQSIHKLWGFGVLEEWDERSSSNPYNDRNLLTTLEMVLNGDGTVSKVTVVRPSGNLDYDVAAIDVAYSAGPYPDPPREIRSRNGKIYIHWRFYRDERQCATSGVDYYILNTPPAGGDKGPTIGEGSGESTGDRAGEGDAPHASTTSPSSAPSDDPAKAAPPAPAGSPSPPAASAAPPAPPAGVTEDAPRRLAQIGHDGAGPRSARMRRTGQAFPAGGVRPTSTSARAPPAAPSESGSPS